jgi:23S rRNA (guanosine2251-2'-O)-methyltransferase
MVCGIQPVREAIRAHGERVHKVVVESGRGAGAPTPTLAALERFARDHGIAVERMDRSGLDRATRGARHQGALALVPPFSLVAPADVDLGLVVALDEIEDPQNFGAIIRSSVALGATAIVWPEHHAAPLSVATARASAGAIEAATLCRVTSLRTALADFKARGASVLGLDANGEDALASRDLTGNVVIVVGAEGKGLRRPVKQICDALVRLPMSGSIASLNASVACGIALYEVARQRGDSVGGPT